MNKGLKIGLVVVAILLVLLAFWKLSAPVKVVDENKSVPKTQEQETPQPLDENGTTALDSDLLATTGVQESDDSVVTSNEGLISAEPA